MRKLAIEPMTEAERPLHRPGRPAQDASQRTHHARPLATLWLPLGLLGVLGLLAGLAAGPWNHVPAQAAERPGAPKAASQLTEEEREVRAQAEAFLKQYLSELAALDKVASLADWEAATTGKAEAFAASARANLALRKFHSDPQAYRRVQELLKQRELLSRGQARSLELAQRAYRPNQLPPELLKRLVDLSTEIERTFKTFRAEMDGRRWSNNELLHILSKETDSSRRQKAWEALKQVGAAAGPKLRELAELRNESARELGFKDYWEMKIRLQEHDPEQLLAIFDELDRLTRGPFTRMKRKMDGELVDRFGVEPGELMPWHYDNPFFQAPPPSAAVDLDEFYEDKTKEEIVEIARRFFAEIGLPVDGVLARSDLYEREGKDQHAFCTDIDRQGDVRILCNVRPTAEWMDTTLHELGHAVYDLGIDRRLRFNLRSPAHIFTTEGVAMLFGALGKDPEWMVAHAGADKARAAELAPAILEQRRREQLIFARWTLVMLHFEKALYEDPQRELNTLWWDLKERYQLLKRPPGRDLPDWAAKPHFTIAPVYYHNYMLGELFAAQLRHRLAELAADQGTSGRPGLQTGKQLGDFLRQEVFRPGKALKWPQFVRRVTGEPLTARYFAEEVKGEPGT